MTEYSGDSKVMLQRLADGMQQLRERKIYELVTENESLKTQISLDGLTGAYNKSYIKAQIGEEIRRSERSGKPFSVIFGDLRAFKEINDTLGHLYGDEILKMSAAAMVYSIRNTDLLGRCGGDEFLIILPETDNAGAENAVSRINNNLKEHVPNIAIDLGIYTRMPEGHPGAYDVNKAAEDVIKRADEAMYKNKRSRV